MKGNFIKTRRLIAVALILLMANTLVPVYGSGENSTTALDEWTEVQEIIGQYSGQWEKPPTHVVTGNMTSGAILGNGDLAVVLGGDTDSQTYYIAKSDFWSDGRTSDWSSSEGGTPQTIGGINIRNATTGGDTIDYNITQDILNAEVRSTLPFGGVPINTRAWVAPNENTFITELQAVDPSKPVQVTVEVWSPIKSENASSANVDATTAWATRNTQQVSGKWTGKAAIVAKAIGTDDVKTSIQSTSSQNIATLSFTIPAGKSVQVVSHIDGGKDAENCLPDAQTRLGELSDVGVSELDSERAEWWKNYWLLQYVELGDYTLEEYYYGSLYQMGAASREGKVAPGLFGHWTTQDEPAWGGDYTLDYNFYGPFNGMSSSNRLEQFAPMFQPIIDFIPAGKIQAQSIKTVNGKSYPDGLPGVAYPAHIGPWGMETYFDCYMRSHAVFASVPFTWYYNYTQDKEFLANVAYPYLIEVVNFWDEYLQKDSSTGKYVVYDSNARESWDSVRKDINPVLDIAFTYNLYKNIIPMSEALGVDADRREKWQDIFDNLSPLPTTTFNGRTVFKEADNRDEISTYGLGDNPVNMQGIFPGANVGLDSDDELLQTARNSLSIMNSWNQANAFPNIFVMGARVGWPAQDLFNKIKSRVSQIREPNLTYQADGHGLEGTGVIEAINSMLMQSHENVLRLFPVWPEKDAKFTRMRGFGAFLVDSEIKSGVVQYVDIYSEKGKDITVLNPWEGKELIITMDGKAVDTIKNGDRYTFSTETGKTYIAKPEGGLPDPIEPTPEPEPIVTTKSAPLPTPDIGWWKFNEDSGNIAVDSSENGYDGKITGAAHTVGQLNNALEFNGSSDYVFIDDYEKPESIVTYTAWVKADSYSEWGAIVKNWGESQTGQMQLGLTYNSNKLIAHVKQSNDGEVTCEDPSEFPLGIWQHVAMVADGSRIRLYRNGVEVANAGYNGSLKTSFAPLTIGAKSNDAQNGASAGYWDGMIDDVRIYSTALSEDDIATLANFKRYSSFYNEDFEDNTAFNSIQDLQNGWSFTGFTGNTRELELQRGTALGMSSNAVRFGSADKWYADMSLFLNLQENGAFKMIRDGINETEAQNKMNDLLSSDMRLKFQIHFNPSDIDTGAAGDGKVYYYVKLKDSMNKAFATLRVVGSKVQNEKRASMDLIALDSTKTSNKAYNIITQNENALMKPLSIVVDFRRSDNSYKISVNGTTAQTENGEWIPASSKDAEGDAEPYEFSDLILKELEFSLGGNGWYQTFSLDNIDLSSLDDREIINTDVLSAVSSGENQYEVEAVFGNVNKDEYSAKVIYALYDENDKVVGMSMDDVFVEGSSSIVGKKTIEYSGNPVKLKMFTWNDIDEMLPLSLPYSMELSQ